jgi:hypothetical protein
VSQGSHKITKGDTRTPLGVYLVRSDGRPVDLTGKTVKFEMYPQGSDTAVVDNEDAVVQPTQTFTLDAGNGWLYAVDHKVQEGQQVVLSTSGSLSSTGVAIDTRYFARNVHPNCFQLSHTPGGPIIDIEGAGTGTHSVAVIGTCTYDFADEDVGTAGSYRAWFKVIDSDGDFERFPNDGVGFTVEVKDVP